MKFRGEWSDGITYDVGDVVQYPADKVFYHLQNPCKAGVTPVDTLYWGKLDQAAAQIAGFIMDSIGLSKDYADSAAAAVEAKIPTNIDNESIVLASGDNEYLVSVDATGETPELVVELIEPDDDTEGGDADNEGGDE